MPVVRNAPSPQAGGSANDDSVEPVVHCMKWGLVPSFSKKNEKPDHFRMVSLTLTIVVVDLENLFIESFHVLVISARSDVEMNFCSISQDVTCFSICFL